MSRSSSSLGFNASSAKSPALSELPSSVNRWPRSSCSWPVIVTSSGQWSGCDEFLDVPVDGNDWNSSHERATGTQKAYQSLASNQASTSSRSSGCGLSWKVRSARDRTIRTFQIRVRFKFLQNSGIFPRKIKNFGKFQHFLNYRRNSDKILSKSEQKSMKRIQKWRNFAKIRYF